MKSPKSLIIAALLLLSSFLSAQEAPKDIVKLSRAKVMERIDGYQRQLNAQNQYLEQLLTPEEREKLVSQTLTTIKDLQRGVGIMKALIADTTLAFVDVPTTALDSIKVKDKPGNPNSLKLPKRQ